MRTILWIIIVTAAATTLGNMLANPQILSDGKTLPTGWDTDVRGTPPEFSVDTEVTHAGQSSVRIDARDMTRAYLRSEPIPVATGETIMGGAWVKWKPQAHMTGTMLCGAEFTDSDGTGRTVQKLGAADPKNSDWQEITGETVVPPNVTRMRLLIGFSYSEGTLWIAGAQAEARAELVARVAPLHGELSPATDSLPVTFLNRQSVAGRVGLQLILAPAHRNDSGDGDDGDDEVDPTKKPVASQLAIKWAEAAMRDGQGRLTNLNVNLDGTAQQIVNMPVPSVHEGDGELYLLMQRDGRTVFGSVQPVHVPPPLVLQPPSPTHWVVEDGAPRFTQNFELAVNKQSLSEGKFSIELLDNVGHYVNGWTPTVPLRDGINSYALQTNSLGIGQYRIDARFVPAHGQAIIAEQHWSVIPQRLAEVEINSAGYPVYDGHAIFPLGMFNGSLWAALQASGFTISHAYNAADVIASQPPDDRAAQRFLDESQAHGLKAVFLIPRGYVFAGQWDAFRRRMRMFRNHPALLAWDEEEGIARGDLSPANFQKMLQIIRDEDPHHPIMVGDSRDTIGRMGDRSNFFPPGLDMGMWWWYPFPLKKLAAGALAGDEGASDRELVLPTFLTHRNTGKPIWVGVQSYRHTPTSPYPTPSEYRAQAYAAICAGAKGLMWYGGGVTGGLQSNPKAAHWGDLQKIVREISGLADFWMEPDTHIPKIEPSDNAVGAIIKQHARKEILVVVNRSVFPKELTVHLAASDQSAQVIGEARNVKLHDGELRDHWEGLGVHVYEIETQK